MAEGAISPELPWVHKEGLALLKASYASQDEAKSKNSAELEAFYRSQHPEVLTSNAQKVRPPRSVSHSLRRERLSLHEGDLGTHPNHIGHMNYPGCFRCHDGNHAAKNGTASRRTAPPAQPAAVDEAKPKVLADLGIQYATCVHSFHRFHSEMNGKHEPPASESEICPTAGVVK